MQRSTVVCLGEASALVPALPTAGTGPRPTGPRGPPGPVARRRAVSADHEPERGQGVADPGPAGRRSGQPGPAGRRPGRAQDDRVAAAAHAGRAALRVPRREQPLPPGCAHPRAVLARVGAAGGAHHRRAAPARLQPRARPHHAPVRAGRHRGRLHRQAGVARPRADGVADRAARAGALHRGRQGAARRPAAGRAGGDPGRPRPAAHHPEHDHRPGRLPGRAGHRPPAGLVARPGGERTVDQLHRRPGAQRVRTRGGRGVGVGARHRGRLRPAARPAAGAAGGHRTHLARLRLAAGDHPGTRGLPA